MMCTLNINLPFCGYRLAALQLKCVNVCLLVSAPGGCVCSISCLLPVCADYLQELLPDVVLILGSEVLVDWIKHAFLLKFNNIEPEVCTTYICRCVIYHLMLNWLDICMYYFGYITCIHQRTMLQLNAYLCW